MFLYNFQARPPFSPKPDFIAADHGDDFLFTFDFTKFHKVYGIDIKNDSLHQADKISSAFVQYLTSFAKTGWVSLLSRI